MLSYAPGHQKKLMILRADLSARNYSGPSEKMQCSSREDEKHLNLSREAEAEAEAAVEVNRCGGSTEFGEEQSRRGQRPHHQRLQPPAVGPSYDSPSAATALLAPSSSPVHCLHSSPLRLWQRLRMSSLLRLREHRGSKESVGRILAIL